MAVAGNVVVVERVVVVPVGTAVERVVVLGIAAAAVEHFGYYKKVPECTAVGRKQVVAEPVVGIAAAAQGVVDIAAAGAAFGNDYHHQHFQSHQCDQVVEAVVVIQPGQPEQQTAPMQLDG